MHKYNLNPELNSLRKMRAVISKPLLPFLNLFMKMVFRLTSDSEVSVKTYTVQGYKNEEENAVDVEIMEVTGACHGFETVTNSSVTRNAMDRRIAFCTNIMA